MVKNNTAVVSRRVRAFGLHIAPAHHDLRLLPVSAFSMYMHMVPKAFLCAPPTRSPALYSFHSIFSTPSTFHCSNKSARPSRHRPLQHLENQLLLPFAIISIHLHYERSPLIRDILPRYLAGINLQFISNVLIPSRHIVIVVKNALIGVR